MKYIKKFENIKGNKFEVGEFVKKDKPIYGTVYCKVVKVFEGFGKVFWYDLVFYDNDGTCSDLVDMSVEEYKLHKLTEEDSHFLVNVGVKKYNL